MFLATIGKESDPQTTCRGVRGDPVGLWVRGHRSPAELVHPLQNLKGLRVSR
jgi:hypothetical protein